MAKQVQEMIFSRRTKKFLPLSFSFNNIPLKNSMFQQNSCVELDVKLSFVEYIKHITQTISETIGLLQDFY